MSSNIPIIAATILLFLFAVSKFSRSIETAAGEKVKGYLTKATATPLRATVVGGVVNAIIQSNTALTVILVGLVNAGLVTFRGSLGLIIGANVGNTLTSQLVAYNIVGFAPAFIVAGFLMRRINNSLRHYAGPVFYFGLLFLTLSYLQLLIDPYSSSPAVLSLISSIDTVFEAALIGILGACIFQSSTMVSVLAITFATQGILNFDQAFGIVVGSGVGTTVTALAASFVMNHASQRTALSHTLFNVLSVIVGLVFYSPIKSFILSFGTSLGQSIANAHLFVSLAAAVISLVAFKAYACLVEFIIPDRGWFHKSRAAIEDKLHASTK